MTRTEDRIRDALGALADLVPAAGAPRTSPETTGTGRHSVRRAERGGRRRRLYIPAAAAIGTAVVIMLAFILGPLGSGTRSGSDSAGASPVRTLPAAAAPSARPTVPPPPPTTLPKPDPARAARFFAVIEDDATFVHRTVTIRDAANGKVTATAAVPEGVRQWYSLSGTAVPGLFYLAGYAESSPPGHGHSAIYRLTVDDRGRFSTLTPVGIDGSLPDIIWQLAVSPDGTRLAFPVGQSTDDLRWKGMRIDIADAASGRRMTFQSGVTGVLSNVSWDAAGRYLGFEMDGNAPPNDGLWVLDTAAPGDLFARSRKVPTVGLGVGMYTGIVLSADARRFYLVSGEETMTVVEVDARSGGHRQVFRIRAGRQPASPGWNNLLARSPAGTDLLLMETGGVCHRINLATFAATDLRYDGGPPKAVAW